MNNETHPKFPPFTRKEVQENPILRTFNLNLPPPLFAAAQPFYEAAVFVVRNLPPNAERTTCLRKLREAKDCAVTAVVIKAQLDEEAANAGGA